MNFRKRFCIAATLVVMILASNPQSAQAGIPVIDVGHIAVSVENAFNSAMNWGTNVVHEAKDAAAWVTDYIEQQMQSGLLGYILSINEIMQGFQNEIMNAAGTVNDIIGIPSNIMNDIFGMLGSVKDTIMSVAGVSGTFTSLQDVFTNVSEIEALGTNAQNGINDLLDFGSFGNAYGAYTSIRGVQARTSVEQLKMVDQERQTVEKIVGTFENSNNAAEIAKGNAQMGAATYRQLARSSELQAIDTQRQIAESWSREAAARSRAAVSQAAAAEAMVRSLD